MSGQGKAIPVDSLLQLRQRLNRLPHKSPERAAQIAVRVPITSLMSKNP
jgi:hypothetical protein